MTMRKLMGGTLAMLLCLTSRGAADDFKIEEGFKPLFNGKDLSGWKERNGGALDGKTETAKPAGRFKVADGAIVIDAKAKGNVFIDSVKTFEKDVHLIFEFKAEEGCNNDVYLRGTKFDLKKGDIKNLKLGEWQKFEIIVKGDNVEFKCDGESQKPQKAKAGAAPFSIRAEFGPVQIRRVRYKE
jgi:hypothetical protein